MQTFLTWDLVFYAFIFEWKKSKPVTRTLYSQTGKYMKWAETFVWCLLLFLKLYTGIIWHSYFPSHWISQQKGSGWSGAKWVKHTHMQTPFMNQEFIFELCVLLTSNYNVRQHTMIMWDVFSVTTLPRRRKDCIFNHLHFLSSCPVDLETILLISFAVQYKS